MDDEFDLAAIRAVNDSTCSYCKFLSANDSGETGGHQSGILLSRTAEKMFFTPEEMQEHIAKRAVTIRWQDDVETASALTWYESKGELRLTRFGNGFRYLQPQFTGALFVMSATETRDYYKAYILNTDEEIQSFLSSFGLTPADTNTLISIGVGKARSREDAVLQQYASHVSVFPSSVEMSGFARAIYYDAYLAKGNRSLEEVIHNRSDQLLVEWTREEYSLFRAIEETLYGKTVRKGFSSVDEFVKKANEVLNRRKSRAGKSLEHHLSAIFDANHLKYTAQGVTEGNKRPDFVFPSIEDYHNFEFPIENICTLAAKTTCKDRWRQVLNESNRLKGRTLYLCTMQQGISSQQMDEMISEHVQLVVPKPFIPAYPAEYRTGIWTVNHFVGYVSEMEDL